MPSAEGNSVIINPHPPRLRMKRRKTVSVTPAMGARTVAGEMLTAPMDSEGGTTCVARAPPPASAAESEAPELSQNFFTVNDFITSLLQPSVAKCRSRKAAYE